MRNEIIGGLVIIYKKTKNDLKFLLLKHKNGFWTFSGGMKEEKDRDIVSCVVRETEEETGLIIKKENLAETDIKNEFEYGPEKGERVGERGITHFFLYEVKDTVEIKPLHNIEEVKWIGEEEVYKLIQFEDIKQKFNEVVKSIK